MVTVFLYGPTFLFTYEVRFRGNHSTHVQTPDLSIRSVNWNELTVPKKYVSSLTTCTMVIWRQERNLLNRLFSTSGDHGLNPVLPCGAVVNMLPTGYRLRVIKNNQSEDVQFSVGSLYDRYTNDLRVKSSYLDVKLLLKCNWNFVTVIFPSRLIKMS